jgi:hypothetical protein
MKNRFQWKGHKQPKGPKPTKINLGNEPGIFGCPNKPRHRKPPNLGNRVSSSETVPANDGETDPVSPLEIPGNIAKIFVNLFTQINQI